MFESFGVSGRGKMVRKQRGKILRVAQYDRWRGRQYDRWLFVVILSARKDLAVGCRKDGS